MIESARHFEQTVTQYQWNAGLEGDFNDMDWDVFINEGYRSLTVVRTPVSSPVRSFVQRNGPVGRSGW